MDLAALPVTGPPRTMWKATLRPERFQWVTFPKAPVIRAVGLQHGRIQLWAEVAPSLPPDSIGVYILATGEEFPIDVGRYLGTVQLDTLVWHVYLQWGAHG